MQLQLGTPNLPLGNTQESRAHGGSVPSWCLAWLRCSCCVGCVLTGDLHAPQKIGESRLMPRLDSRTLNFLNIFSVFHWDLVDYYCHVWFIFNSAMVLIFIYSRQVQSWNKQVQLQGKPWGQIWSKALKICFWQEDGYWYVRRGHDRAFKPFFGFVIILFVPVLVVTCLCKDSHPFKWMKAWA